MQVSDVMSRWVITVRPHMSARAAASQLASHGITSAPVVTAEGVLRGILSEGDLMRARSLLDPPTSGQERDIPVADLMTPEPVSMRPDAELADVVTVMLEHGIRSVPIVVDGRLIGIVSRQDVLRCIARRQPVARLQPEVAAVRA